jgi:phospholipase C
MDAAQVAWGDYYAASIPLYNTYTWPAGYPNTHAYSTFLPALDAGTLPPVVYLDTPSDEHPPGSVHDGEGVIYDIVKHAFASPLWPHLAIVFNYDEGGGFFDHVPPPAACKPSSSAPDATYTVNGIRVPLIVISPYARKAFVSHVDHAHTSVMRLVELLHDLPAVTARDANSDALLDMFDFACPDFATPPVLGARPPGGC